MAGRASSYCFSYVWTYDVFLGFGSQDTCHGFIDNLYNALVQRGIRTFIVDEELQRGAQMTPALVKAIEESRIAILVLSKNYAASSFCLDELVQILDCVRGKGRLVLPVFYDVDPSDALRQRGIYGDALAKHEEKFNENKEKVHEWRMTLHRVANFPGWHFKHGDGYEHEFIKRIVEEVSSKITRSRLYVADYPVGLEPRVLEVNSLLDVGSDDEVHMVGIYGIGGIGKTTLARAVYNLIADQFDGVCFLDGVTQNSAKRGLLNLQEKLLSEIAGYKDIKLGSVEEGVHIIKQRLHRKKVLLVLDDVNRFEQLRAIVGEPDWFGSGSRVIVTTRDKRLLVRHGVERAYEVEKLNEKDALELLSWNAFKHCEVDPSFVDQLNRVVTYASGIPLALEVLGSRLFGKSIEEWRSTLDEFEGIKRSPIHQVLKLSFDALREDQQNIFLDIACGLEGYELAQVEDILGAHHGFGVKHCIRELTEKSLISIDRFGHVALHDLIQDMGREIVRQEAPNELGKRSRLWFPQDIVEVLENNMGTSTIRVIILDSHLFEEKVVKWDGKAFKNMNNLKILIIRNGRFSKGPKYLPNSLRVLEWWGYPSESLPSDFHPKQLAVFKLPHNCFMSPVLLKLLKKFVNLRVLDFSHSKCITQIPDVCGVPNLEELSFRFCENLIKIHESVGFMDKLRILDAYGCRKLRSFPPIMLTSLEELKLSHCSSLDSFPEILGKMENITQLYLEYTPIKHFPFSIRNLTQLRSLNLIGCGMLQLLSSIGMLPELSELIVAECVGLRLSKQDFGEEKMSSMVSSNAELLLFLECHISDEFLEIGFTWFANVKELDLSSSNFTILPATIKECHLLRKLNLDYCENLREIRGIPPNIETLSARHCTSLKDLDLTLLPACARDCRFLRRLILNDCENLLEIQGILPNIELFSASNCTSLTSSCRSMLLCQELHEEAGNKLFFLPGREIPKWFEHRSRGLSISFWFRNKFPAISICFVIGLVDKHRISFRFHPKLIINGNLVNKDFLVNKGYSSWFGLEADHIFIFDQKQIKFEDNVDEVLLGNEWNHVVFSIDVHNTVSMGLHVFKQKGSMEDIQFTNPYKGGKLDDDLITSE